MIKRIPALFSILFSFAAQSQTYDFSSVDNLLNANLNTVFNDKVVCMAMLNDSLIYYYHQGADSLTTGGVASCSKTLSAALMLRLVQEGTVHLDDSIAQYYSFATAPGKGKMTLRNLFAHTSGLSGTTQYNAETDINLQQSADSILTIDSLIYTPIGTKFSYTGEDQQVAGAAAELAAGMSWDNLFAAKIAQPLHLNNTNFYATTPTNPRVAGGIRTNSVDMLRFAQFILHNGKNEQGIQVVDSVLMQELWKDQTNHAIQIASPYPRSPANNNPYNAKTIYYGLGTWLDIYNPSQQYQEQISADGALGGIIWINRCTHMSGAFLTFTPSNYITTYPVEYMAMDIFRNAVPYTCYFVLPVSLTDFAGEADDTKNDLSWQTNSEINTSGFEIQRSENGIDFYKIGFSPTKALNGVSNTLLKYDFADFNPGTYCFYRLKQIDREGKFSYSKIISLKRVSITSKNPLVIYPNPAHQSFTVELHETNFDINTTDIKGRKTYESRSNSGKEKIDSKYFPNGIYFIHASTTNSSFTQKLIIEH